MQSPQLPQLVLASASPRRRALLEQIGVCFVVQVADVDEAALPDETPEKLVERLALAKAGAVWQQRTRRGEDALPVLGSDTLGILDGTVLLKPVDFADAQRMLRKMSGRQHIILSAVALVDANGGKVLTSRSVVKFCSFTDAEILAYWGTGEPQDKAGAYAIQGLGALFVEYLQGSYSGVMGLPLFETGRLLAAADIKIL